jgi:hypothetical protein
LLFFFRSAGQRHDEVLASHSQLPRRESTCDAQGHEQSAHQLVLGRGSEQRRKDAPKGVSPAALVVVQVQDALEGMQPSVKIRLDHLKQLADRSVDGSTRHAVRSEARGGAGPSAFVSRDLNFRSIKFD